MSSDQNSDLTSEAATLEQPPVQVHIVPQGPVMTEALFNAVVATIEYHLYDGTTTIACALKLRNGYTVTGEASAVPTTKFEPQIGMQHALQDAKQKLAEALALLVYDVVCPEQFRVASAVRQVIDSLSEELKS